MTTTTCQSFGQVALTFSVSTWSLDSSHFGHLYMERSLSRVAEPALTKEYKPMRSHLRPFVAFTSQGSERVKLVAVAGLSCQVRDEHEPRGRFALWLFRHRHLHSRTRDHGSIREHYRFAGLSLDLEAWRCGISVRLERRGGYWRLGLRRLGPFCSAA